jgi:hypothetical protein
MYHFFKRKIVVKLVSIFCIILFYPLEMQKNSVMKVSFFHSFAWLTRTTASFIKLQINEKKYDFHNYVLAQITI